MLDILEYDDLIGKKLFLRTVTYHLVGKVKRIITGGSYNVPDSDFTIDGTEDNPAVVITLYRDGKPTETTVAHRRSTLRIS
jgi:hypothetical protein